MKTKRCVFCKKRYVRQQEWKTEEEKKFCFTCKFYTDQAQSFAYVLRDYLENRVGMKNMEVAITVKKKNDKS